MCTKLFVDFENQLRAKNFLILLIDEDKSIVFKDAYYLEIGN